MVAGLPCLALVAQPLLRPGSRLACTRMWHGHATSVSDVLGVSDVRVDEVFAAMDWLIARKGRILEKPSVSRTGS